MSQGDFTDFWRRASTNERNIRRNMVGRAERARGNESLVFGQQSGDAVNFGDFQRFGKGKIGQN